MDLPSSTFTLSFQTTVTKWCCLGSRACFRFHCHSESSPILISHSCIFFCHQLSSVLTQSSSATLPSCACGMSLHFSFAARCLHHHSSCQPHRDKPTRTSLQHGYPPHYTRLDSTPFTFLVHCLHLLHSWLLKDSLPRRVLGSHVNSERPSDGSLRSVIYLARAWYWSSRLLCARAELWKYVRR